MASDQILREKASPLYVAFTVRPQRLDAGVCILACLLPTQRCQRQQQVHMAGSNSNSVFYPHFGVKLTLTFLRVLFVTCSFLLVFTSQRA